jgi:N-glycosidase YbiA
MLSAFLTFLLPDMQEELAGAFAALTVSPSSPDAEKEEGITDWSKAPNALRFGKAGGPLESLFPTAPGAISIAAKTFMSVSNYILARSRRSVDGFEDAVRRAPSIIEARAKAENFLEREGGAEEWTNAAAEGALLTAFRTKLGEERYAEVRKELMDTSENVLVFDAAGIVAAGGTLGITAPDGDSRDGTRYWGVDSEGSGANRVGEVLMALRDELLTGLEDSAQVGARCAFSGGSGDEQRGSGDPEMSTGDEDAPRNWFDIDGVVRIESLGEGPSVVTSYFHPAASGNINVATKRYASVEHYVLASSRHGAINAEGRDAEDMLRVITPLEAALAAASQFPVRSDWLHNGQEAALRTAYFAKLSEERYSDLRLALLDTGDQVVDYVDETDRYWGVDSRGVGENRVGRLLAAVRDELRTAEPQDGPAATGSGHVQIRGNIENPAQLDRLAPNCIENVNIWGKRYASVAHFALVQRCASAEAENELRNMLPLSDAERLAQGYVVRDNWLHRPREECYLRAFRAKFERYEDAQSALLATESAAIVYAATPNDDFFGVDARGIGYNRLGEVLMALREELRGGEVAVVGCRSSFAMSRRETDSGMIPPTFSTTGAGGRFPEDSVFFRSEGPLAEFAPHFSGTKLQQDPRSLWTSVQHYFETQRFNAVTEAYLGRGKVKQQLRDMKTEMQLVHASRMLADSMPVQRKWTTPLWREQIFAKALDFRYAHTSEMRNLLLATGSRCLVFDCAQDSYWGTGKDGHGLNVFGELLMDCRSQLRATGSEIRWSFDESQYSESEVNTKSLVPFRRRLARLRAGQSVGVIIWRLRFWPLTATELDLLNIARRDVLSSSASPDIVLGLVDTSLAKNFDDDGENGNGADGNAIHKNRDVLLSMMLSELSWAVPVSSAHSLVRELRDEFPDLSFSKCFIGTMADAETCRDDFPCGAARHLVFRSSRDEVVGSTLGHCEDGPVLPTWDVTSRALQEGNRGILRDLFSPIVLKFLKEADVLQDAAHYDSILGANSEPRVVLDQPRPAVVVQDLREMSPALPAALADSLVEYLQEVASARPTSRFDDPPSNTARWLAALLEIFRGDGFTQQATIVDVLVLMTLDPSVREAIVDGVVEVFRWYERAGSPPDLRPRFVWLGTNTLMSRKGIRQLLTGEVATTVVRTALSASREGIPEASSLAYNISLEIASLAYSTSLESRGVDPELCREFADALIDLLPKQDNITETNEDEATTALRTLGNVFIGTPETDRKFQAERFESFAKRESPLKVFEAGSAVAKVLTPTKRSSRRVLFSPRPATLTFDNGSDSDDP